jgi:hypothetical protein
VHRATTAARTAGAGSLGVTAIAAVTATAIATTIATATATVTSTASDGSHSSRCDPCFLEELSSAFSHGLVYGSPATLMIDRHEIKLLIDH